MYATVEARSNTRPMNQDSEQLPELQTVQGRRLAAIELTSIMAVTGVNANDARNAIQTQLGSPKRSAALNTARFFIDAALRRDVAALETMISLPFLIENRLIGIQEEINSQWIDRLRAKSGPKENQEAVAIIYSTVLTIDEFNAIDPEYSAKTAHLRLSPQDYLAGLVVAVGNIAEPVNVFVRQHEGAMKISGIWS